MSLCVFCKNQIGYRPRATLECCGIDCHTHCLLVQFTDIRVKCPQCEGNLFTQTMENEREILRQQREQKQQNELLELLENNAEFAEEFNRLGNNFMKTRDHFFLYSKKASQIQKVFRNEVKSLNELIKNKIKEHTLTLKKTEQTKLWKQQSQKTKRALQDFEEKYPSFPLFKALKVKFPDWNLPVYQLMKLYFYSPTVHNDYIWLR